LRDVRKRHFLHRKKLFARDIMSTRPFSITEGHSKEDIFKVLSVLNIDYIPCVTEDKEYLGMLNLKRLIKDMSVTQKVYKIR